MFWSDAMIHKKVHGEITYVGRWFLEIDSQNRLEAMFHYRSYFDLFHLKIARIQQLCLPQTLWGKLSRNSGSSRELLQPTGNRSKLRLFRSPALFPIMNKTQIYIRLLNIIDREYFQRVNNSLKKQGKIFK